MKPKLLGPHKSNIALVKIRNFINSNSKYIFSSTSYGQLIKYTFGFLLIINVQSNLQAQTTNDNIKILKEDLNILLQKNDSLNAARTYYKLGREYYAINQIDSSNLAISSGIMIAEGINNPKAISTLANYLASNFSYLGELDSAILYYNIALKASRILADSGRLQKILINLGDDYSSRGDFNRALQCSLEAIQIKEISNDSSNLAYYYQKYGEIFKASGEYEKWEEYTKLAYGFIFIEGCFDHRSRAAVYNDLGEIAEHHEDFNSALSYYDTLEMIGLEEEYPSAIAVANSSKANIYKQRGNIPLALEAATIAKDYRHASDAYHSIYNLNLLAELHLSNNEPYLALKYASLANNHEYINSYLTEKKRSYKILYQSEKERGNHDQALLWNEKYTLLNDSLRNENVRIQITDMELSYQTEKRKQQIELLIAENKLKSQRKWLYIAAIIALIFAIVIGALLSIRRKRKNQQKQQTLKQQLLRSQMNPHFIFNALGSIQNFMLKNETKKAAGYLNNFASLTRNILEHSDKELVSLSDEIETLRSYIELEKMRMQNSFDYEIVYNENMETEFINIPPMLIQPFVENAIKHGLNNINKGILNIKFEEDNKHLNIEIIDNGVGIEQSKTRTNKSHRSMSMDIFEKRKVVLQKTTKQIIQYSIKDRSTIDKQQTGTIVEIKIPIIL